ncbi:hypothetical protein ACFOHT_20810 [Massilia oculi]|nr:hypothetical protein [Massilia oculi]
MLEITQTHCLCGLQGIRCVDIVWMFVDIALEKHPEREDLHFLLSDRSRSLAPLLRKLVAEMPELFTDYDGNQLATI